MRKSVAERLKEKSIPEPNSGCWLWEGTTSNQGYGNISVNYRTVTASRASYETFVCDPGELHVLHKCDNPLCINPDHLFLGTHNDNMRDMVAKGRSTKGAANPMFGRKGADNPMFGADRAGEKNPMFGREQSMKCKLIVQMNNIMRFNPYWGA